MREQKHLIANWMRGRYSLIRFYFTNLHGHTQQNSFDISSLSSLHQLQRLERLNDIGYVTHTAKNPTTYTFQSTIVPLSHPLLLQQETSPTSYERSILVTPVVYAGYTTGVGKLEVDNNQSLHPSSVEFALLQLHSVGQTTVLVLLDGIPLIVSTTRYRQDVFENRNRAGIREIYGRKSVGVQVPK